MSHHALAPGAQARSVSCDPGCLRHEGRCGVGPNDCASYLQADWYRQAVPALGSRACPLTVSVTLESALDRVGANYLLAELDPFAPCLSA
jgi:hypothetical protein